MSRLIRKPELLKLTGISYSTIKRMMKRKEFPARVRLSGNTVAWYEDEVLKWSDSLPRIEP